MADRGNLDFKNNNDRRRYFVVKAQIYMVSLLDFISMFKMLVVVEQSAESDLLAPGGEGGGRPTTPTSPWLP